MKIELKLEYNDLTTEDLETLLQTMQVASGGKIYSITKIKEVKQLQYRMLKMKRGGFLVFKEDLPFIDSKYVSTREKAIKLKKELNDALSQKSEVKEYE